MRPKVAPLKKIVENVGKSWGGGFTALLECGHKAHVSSARQLRVRCSTCLREALQAWGDAHRCPHGIVSEHPGERCERCTINILEAKVARYRAALEEIANLGFGLGAEMADKALRGDEQTVLI